MKTNIRARVERLLARLEVSPQYAGQGKILFVDLERQHLHSAYLPMEMVRTFLGGRGANMALLYNLYEDGRAPLDPEVPLIFGVGIMTTTLPSATRSASISGFRSSTMLRRTSDAVGRASSPRRFSMSAPFLPITTPGRAV